MQQGRGAEHLHSFSIGCKEEAIRTVRNGNKDQTQLKYYSGGGNLPRSARCGVNPGCVLIMEVTYSQAHSWYYRWSDQGDAGEDGCVRQGSCSTVVVIIQLF